MIVINQRPANLAIGRVLAGAGLLASLLVAPFVAAGPARAASPTCDNVEGDWRNSNPATRSITRLAFVGGLCNGGALQVWGRCHPADCLVRFWGDSANPGVLIVRVHTHFTDHSGRTDYWTTDRMIRP